MNSITNGSALDPAVWDCTCIPGATHDLVVQHSVTLAATAVYASLHVKNGGSFSTSSSGNTRINGDLIIDFGGTVTNGRRIDIYGNYAVFGVHSGTSNIRIRGFGNQLTGNANGYISNTARLILMDGDKIIPSGNTLTKNSGRTQLNNGIKVHNHGSFQGGRFGGSTGTKWVNHSGSWLAIRTTWDSQLGLDAQAVSNIVVYNRIGNGNQILLAPVGQTYYDLQLLGTSLSSRKRLRSDITILGDLIIGKNTFDTRRSGIDHDIMIHGKWENQNGVFAKRTSTVTFEAANGVQVSHYDQEEFYDLIISGTDTVTLKAPIEVFNSLTINSTLDVDPGLSNDIDLRGDLTVVGNLVTRSGNVTFKNAGNKSINGNIDFNNLTIDTPDDVNIISGAQSLRGTLSLYNGSLNTNDSLTLLSTFSGTARIAEVTSGTITGDVIVQRYIGAGATNWRFLSTPVSGVTLAEWDNDFVTSGFPGSDYPSFPFISIYTYDESQPGTEDDGFVPATSITDPINIGEGYWVWCGDSLGGTAPFTIDVKGPVNIGSVSLPVQYTTISGPANDGWSMVGNPFASTIDWDDASWTKTNVNDAVYIWDTQDQQFASYVNGVGTNGGSPYIASSQAFWVKANGILPTLSVPESAKSDVDAGFKSNSIFNGLILELAGNGFTDETVIMASANATDLFDPSSDAIKMFSSNPNVPSLSTQILGPVDLAINSIPSIDSDISIPVRAITNASGSYTITASRVAGTFNNSCIVLEDTYTNTMTVISESASYTFVLSDTTDQARFLLHIGVPVQNEVFNTSCAGTSDGSALVTGVGFGPWDYSWFDGQGNMIQNSLNSMNPGLISDLTEGSYSVSVSSTGICPSITLPFDIVEPAAISVGYVVSNSSCADTMDGNIDIEVNGGTAPYTFEWNNGEITEDISELAAGIYTVQIEDQNHCTQLFSIDIENQYSVTASFTAASTEVYMSNGAEVNFTNTSTDAVEYRWFFGDGSPVQFGTDAEHQYSVPAVYTVTLRALVQDCVDEATLEITVLDDVTGIGDINGIEGLSIEQYAQGAFLVISLNEPKNLTVQVFNSIGQEIEKARSGKFLNERIEIASGVKGSMIIVSVTNNENGKVFMKKVVL